MNSRARNVTTADIGAQFGHLQTRRTVAGPAGRAREHDGTFAGGLRIKQKQLIKGAS
jgi:hypothetical protein